MRRAGGNLSQDMAPQAVSLRMYSCGEVDTRRVYQESADMKPAEKHAKSAGGKSALTAMVTTMLLLTLAACTGGGSGVVYSSDFTAGYDPRSLSAAMSRAPLLVETYGSPGADQASGDVARASALALRQHGPSWLPRNYTDNTADAGPGRGGRRALRRRNPVRAHACQPVPGGQHDRRRRGCAERRRHRQRRLRRVRRPPGALRDAPAQSRAG